MIDPAFQAVAQGPVVRPASMTRQERIAEIHRSLALLHEPGNVFEIRGLGVPRVKTVSGYFDDYHKAAIACYHLNNRNPAGIYTNLNPCNPALLARAANRLIDSPKWTTSDGDIVCRCWLFVDIDPVRPSGIAADVGEKETATVLAMEIESLLRARGWPSPLLADSGNGCYLLYRVELPADNDTAELLKQFYVGLNSLLSNYNPQEPHSKLDVSVSNAARIARVGGTVNRKGDYTDERPHRTAFYHQPSEDRPVGLAALEQVEAIAALAKQDSTGLAKVRCVAGGAGMRSMLMVGQWLTDHAVTFRTKTAADGRDVYLIQCPFDETHGERGETSVMQASNGRMSAKCMHDSCTGRGWQEFKRAIGPPNPHHYDPPLNVNGSAQRSSDPPGQWRTLDAGSWVNAGDRNNYGKVLADNGETCTVHFVSTDGNEATKDFDKAELRTQDGSSLSMEADENTRIELIPSSEFAMADYYQRYLVNKILVADQPAIVGGRSKTMKTSIMIDLAIALGTGTQFLGSFDAMKCKVAVLSGESGHFTIQETAKRVADSKGINLADASVDWGFDLPQLACDADLRYLGDLLLAHSIEVLMIDPAYLCLLGGDVKGIRPGDVFSMGPLLLKLSELGNRTNTTVILCHHCRKNSHRELWTPPDLEELSMAGFAEWARQWLLLGRRRAYEQGSGMHQLWLNVGGSAGHSGCYGIDIEEGVLGDDFRGRHWNVTVADGNTAKEEAREERDRQKSRQQEEREADHKRRLLEALRSHQGTGETKSVLRDESGLNAGNFGTAIRALIGEGRADNCRVTKNGKEHDAYKSTGK